MKQLLKIPSMGEGGDEDGSIVNIPIALGDSISVGDTLLEIETDKVTFEVPSEHEGIIEEVTLKVGDHARAGLVFAKLLVNREKSKEAVFDKGVSPEREPLAESIPMVEQQLVVNTILPEEKADSLNKQIEGNSSIDNDGQSKEYIRANPSARRLSREIGVDLCKVEGSGKHGRITIYDVKKYALIKNQSSINTDKSVATHLRALPDLSEFGILKKEPLSRIAITTSNNMSHAWSRIPHAWIQQTIDITELEEWRQENKKQVYDQGGSLTVTVILAKAVAAALKAFPKLKSSFDEENNEIIYKENTDIGIAVDTGDSLVVPTLRQVDKKGMVDLSKELTTLSKKAKAKKLSPKDMQGAGITISNLGGIGLSSIFPIVNWPQVAIIGVAASAIQPTYTNGEITPRRIMTMTIGFDHRVINGAEGAKFLVHVKTLLEDTRTILL